MVIPHLPQFSLLIRPHLSIALAFAEFGLSLTSLFSASFEHISPHTFSFIHFQCIVVSASCNHHPPRTPLYVLPIYQKPEWIIHILPNSTPCNSSVTCCKQILSPSVTSMASSSSPLKATGSSIGIIAVFVPSYWQRFRAKISTVCSFACRNNPSTCANLVPFSTVSLILFANHW